MLLALVPAGGHIVTTTDCYRRTRQFIQTVLPKMGISATVIDPADMHGLEQALKKQRVSLFFSGGQPRWLHSYAESPASHCTCLTLQRASHYTVLIGCEGVHSLRQFSGGLCLLQVASFWPGAEMLEQ